MKHPLSIAISLILAAFPALAQNEQAGAESAGKKPLVTAKVTQSEPTGLVFVEEDVVVDFKRLPTAFMQAAVNDFSEKNLGEAASDLRAAARVFKAQERGSITSEARDALTTASSELEKLAKDIKSGSIPSQQQLKSRLGPIAYQNALFHRLAAENEWSKKEYRRAGQDLQAATQILEAGGRWANATVPNTGEIQDVADNLVQGRGWATSDVKQAFSDLSAALKSFADKAAPNRARAGTEEKEKF